MEFALNRITTALAGFGSVVAALALSQASVSAAPRQSPQAAQTAAARAAARNVQAGSYRIDANHTQVLWSVDHMGFSRLYGMVGGMSGWLQLDPARLGQARLEVDIPLSGLTVTSAGFGRHLATADLFDVAQFPTARFVSRTVTVRGQEATIVGDLTLRGVTRPVTLQARFYGAGANPMSQAQTVGFSARGQLKRSDFGLGYAVPAVSDTVDLEITAAFEKEGSGGAARQ
jgi:polyisoprenoid-binding protein YceI